MHEVDNWDDEIDETCKMGMSWYEYGMSVKTGVPFCWHL